MGKSKYSGEIIKIQKNELFPADVLILKINDHKKGKCYIETKSLDGETTLKRKSSPLQTNKLDIKEIVTSQIVFEF